MRKWSTMQRVVAVLALVAGLALTGCGKSEPDVAAYVGSKKITHAQVEEVTKGLDRSALLQGNPDQAVLGQLVALEVGRRMVAEKGLTVQPVDPAQIAEQAGLPPGSRLARLLAETQAVLQALAPGAGTVAPTEEDQREVFDTLLFRGQRVADTQEFGSVRGLLTEEQLGVALAVRKQLDEAAEKYGVTVNPRYTQLTYAIPIGVQDANGNLATATIVLPFGAGSVATGAR